MEKRGGQGEASVRVCVCVDRGRLPNLHRGGGARAAACVALGSIGLRRGYCRQLWVLVVEFNCGITAQACGGSPVASQIALAWHLQGA